MSKIDVDDLDEKPLDPEVEKIRRKMVRLLAVSIGIMIVGVMAVLAAVVYRIAQSDAPADEPVAENAPAFLGDGDQPLSVEAALPEGFAVDHVALDGANVLFFGTQEGRAAGYVVDLRTGRILADIRLGE